MKTIETKKNSILIIDDSIDMLDLQKLILESEGYSVSTAENIETALQILTERESPDLILLDYRLDGSTGDDFLEQLEERKPEVLKNTTTVFYSGVDDLPIDKVSGFISKLTSMGRLLEEIRFFIEKGHHAHP